MGPALRRMTVWLLNPRPRWWASARFVLVLTILFLHFMGYALLQPAYVGRMIQGTVVGFDDGTVRALEDGSTGDHPPALLWSVDASAGWWRGVGYERLAVKIWSLRRADGNPAPPAAAHTAAGVALAPDHAGADCFDKMIQALIASRSGLVTRRTWWRRLIDGVHIAAFAVLLACPIVGYLRAVQGAWYRTVLQRAEARMCGACGYDMKGAPATVCPECRTDVAALQREAEAMLGGPRQHPRARLAMAPDHGSDAASRSRASNEAP